MLIVLDTETTGITPGQICQLAYVVDDGVAARGVNWFFSVDEMEPGAQMVHGFSLEGLREASGGRRFGDDAARIAAELGTGTTLAAHNLNFDRKFLETEFGRAGVRLPMKHGLCTMYTFTKVLGLKSRRGNLPKPPSLAELMRFFGVTAQAAMDRAEGLFGPGGAAHDARYDSTAAWMCLRAAMERGLVRNLLPENPGQTSFL